MILPPHNRGDLSAAQWKCYGPRHSVSGRFYRWRSQGIWRPHLTEAPTIAERSGEINWEIHFVDGSVVRAHQHAAGARRGELDPNSALSAIEQVQQREALGWSKGGFSTKIHLRCDGNGRPMTFLVSVGERHEAVLFEPLMEQGSVKRSGPGRPRIRPHRVSGDKGYSSGKIRCYLRRRGIRYTIARKANEHRGGK